MKRAHCLLAFFCYIRFINGLHADSVLVKSCAPRLCPAGEKFSYQPGYTYIYNYGADVSTTISGATKDFTSIFIEAQAEINAITSCELTLKLRNVDLRSRNVDNPAPNAFASGHQQFKEALEKWTLRFSFEDGAIENLCAEPAEEPWVLNIKRALVSVLQNRANINAVTSTQMMERDIQGSCPTEYTLDYVFVNLRTNKTKDLDKCKERHMFLSAIQSSPYLSLKTGQLNPALRSSYSCKQDLVNEIIQRVSCEERHILRPFSNGDGGAMTMTKQTLVLVDEIRRATAPRVSATLLRRTTLLFDHNYQSSHLSKPDTLQSQHEAEIALHRLCDVSRDGVSADSPLQFWQLVKALKRLDYLKLKEVFDNANRICDFSPRGQKLFLDALPMIGSPVSLTLMKELILSGSVAKSKENAWLDAVAFHPQPTRDILTAIMPLLKVPHVSPKALLSITALANSYCQTISACSAIDEIRTLISVIERLLGVQCTSHNPDEIEKIVMALKAMGNLGLEMASYSVLERCIATTKNPTIIRLTAVTSYRRLPCSVSRDHLLHLFLNASEDSEIRIAAYLAVMKCPSVGVVNNIWMSLQNESVNQVNSFVWSHLSSIQKSVDPAKMPIRAIVEDVDLLQKYNRDVRKYSGVFEKSAFSELLNVGANLETHLIYSPKSYIPRSAMLNLTVDLFGHAINLVELNGRIEGLDHLAENLFRPIPHSAEIKINPEGMEPPEVTNPNKNSQMVALSQKVKSHMKSLLPLEPSALFSMKVFGQEVWFNSIKKAELESMIQHWLQYSYADFLEFLSLDNDVDFSKESVLMDLTYATPTLAGLPLILSLNATASVHLKMGGRMDIRRFANSVCNIEGQIRPSAAVSVLGSMTVDGYVGKSGVKIDANLHTSTVLDGKVEVTDNKRVKVHFNLPKERLDFVQVSTNLHIDHWGLTRPLRSNSADRTEVLSCSRELTSSLLGIEFCSEFRYPNASQRASSPFFPLTGPTRIGIWLQKTDHTLLSYNFDYHLDKGSSSLSSSSAPRSFVLSFNTPHSTQDREWTINYADNPLDKSMHLRLATPYKKILIKGHYSDDDSRKGLYADVHIDDKEEFSFQAEVRTMTLNSYMHYLPRVIIRVPTHIVMSLEGDIRYNTSQFLNVNIVVENLTIKSIVFRGEVTKIAEENDNIHYSSVLNSPFLDATVKGSLNKTHGGLVSKTHLEYQMANASKKETVDLTMKMRYISPASRSLTTATAVIDVHTSAAPEYNSIVNWNFQLAEGHIENTIVVDSTDNGRKTQIARLQQILNYEGILEEHKVKSKFEVKVPSRNIHIALTVDHLNRLQMLSTKVFLKRNVNHEYGFEVKLHDDSTHPWKFQALTLIHWNGVVNGLSVNISEITSRHYMALVSSYGRPFGNLNATIHSKNNSTDIYLDQVLQITMIGDTKMTAKGSVFVMEDRGNAKLDVDLEGQTYQGEVTYKKLKPKEFESQFAIVSPRQKFNGIAQFNLGDDKVLHLDVRSNSGRRIIITIHVKYLFDVKSGGLYLAWDVDRYPGQQFNISLLDEHHLDLSRKYFNLVFLERAVGLKFDHCQRGSPFVGYFFQETDVLIEWAAAKIFAVDLDMKMNAVRASQREIMGTLNMLTPLSAMETLLINVTHNDDGLSWKSEGRMLVNQRFPYRLISEGKYWHAGNQQYIDSSTNITTPIDHFEKISVNFEHHLASREIKTDAQLSWSPGSGISVHVYGIVPKSKYDKAVMKVNVTTPFVALRTLGFIVDHKLNPGQISSEMRLNWNGEEKFSGLLTGETKREGGSYVIFGNVLVVTPLEGFDNFTIIINHLHDIHGFNTRLDTLLPQNNMFSWHGSGRFKRTVPSILLEGRFDLNSYLISFGTGVMYERNGSEFKSIVRGNWNKAFANFSADGAYESMTNFWLNALFTSSLKGLQHTSFIAMNKLSGSSIATQLYGKLSQKECGFMLNGQWDFHSSVCHSLIAEFRLDSPLSALPQVTFNATHGCEGVADYHTRIHGTWNTLQVTVNHTLALQDRFNFKDILAFSLPFDDLKHVCFTVNQSWSSALLNNSLQLLVNHTKLVGSSMDFKKSFMASGQRKIDAMLRLDSSIWFPHRMQIIMDHSDDGHEYHPKIIFETMEPSSKVLQLTGSLKSSPGSKMGHLLINTKIPHYENVALSGMYSMSDTILAYNFSSQWTPTHRLAVDGEIGIDFFAPCLRLHIITPMSGYKTFKLDGRYSVWSADKRASFFVQKEDWTLSLAGSGIFEPDEMVSGLVVVTPSASIGTIHLNSSVSWNQTTVRGFKAVLSWNDKNTIMIYTGLQPYKNGVTTLTTSVITPLQWIRNVDFIVKISKEPDTRLVVETSTRWNRAEMVDVTIGLLQTALIPLSVSFMVKSTTPLVPLVTAIFKIESGTNRRSVKFDYSSGGKKLKAHVQLRYRSRKSDLDVEIETPFSHFPKGSLHGSSQRKGQSSDITVTLSLPLTEMQKVTVTGVVNAVGGNVSRGVLTVRTFGQTSVVKVEHISNDTGIAVSLNADPVVTDLKISEIKFSYKTEVAGFIAHFSLIDKNGRHDIFIQIVGPLSDIHLNGQIASPLLKDRTPIDAEVHLRAGSSVGMYGSVAIKEAGTDKHHLLLDVRAQEPLSAIVRFSGASPLFHEGKNHEFSVSVTKTANGLKTSTLLNLPSGKYFWRSEYERDLMSDLISLLVDAGSPLKELNQFKVQARKAGGEWDNVELDLHILTPVDGYEEFSTRISTKHRIGDLFDFTVYIDTPFEGYEAIGFEESLKYNFEAMTCISNSNFTFGGVTTSFLAWYVKLGKSVDFGVEAHWRPTLSAVESEETSVKSDSNGRINCKISCPTRDSDKMLKFSEQQFCLAEILLKGTPWEVEGSWNYSSWRIFHGVMFIDTPLQSVQKAGLEASNDVKIGNARVKSRLALHWAGQKVADILIQGAALANGRKQGSVNITTPFSLVRQVDGRGYVLHNADGISGNVDVDVNNQTLFSGTTELLTFESSGWRNRTIRFDLENPWQPFGLSILTFSHSNVLTLNTSLAWNLIERETHSLKSFLKILYTSFGRTVHVMLVHPKHMFDLVTSYQKLPSNFSHATAIHIGVTKSKLLAYELWLRSDDREETTIRKNAGFRWEHPGRVMLCAANVLRQPRSYQTELDFQWDASRDEDKQMKLNMNYEEVSSGFGKAHKVKVVLHHPKLSRDVELNSDIILDRGAEAFKGGMTLMYSPFEQAKLNLNAGLRRSLPSDNWQGFEFELMAKHDISNLDLKLSSGWMKSADSLMTNTTFMYLDKDSHHIDFALEGLGNLFQETALLVRNSGQSTKFTMTMHHPESNNYTVILVRNVNNQPHHIAQVLYQKNKPYLEARASSLKDSHGYVQFFGGFQALRKFILQILHGHTGNEVRDFSVVVKLNTTHFLTTRVYWVSNILQQAKKVVGQYLSFAHKRTMASLWHMWDFSLVEVASKFELGWESFSMAMLPVFSELKSELDIFIDDLDQVRNFFSKIYTDGDPLYQDIVKYLDKAQSYFRAWYDKVWGPFTWSFDRTHYIGDSVETFRHAWKSVQNNWNSLSNSWMLQIWEGFYDTFLVILNLIDELWERLGGVLSTLPTALTNMLTNLKSSSNEMLSHFSKLLAVGEQIKTFWGKIYALLNGIKTWIKEKIFDAFTKWIFTSDIYLYLHTQLINAFNGFINFIRYYWLELVIKWMNVTKIYMVESQKKVVDTVISNLRGIRDAIWTFIPNIINHSGIKKGIEAVKALQSKVYWVLQYYRLIPEGYLTLFEWYNYWVEKFTVTAEESSDGFDSSNYVLFETENGLVEVDQQLPFPWKSLKESPQIQEMKEIKIFYRVWKVLNSYNAPAPYNAFEPPFLTWYNKLQKQFDYRTWFPPFEGQAVVAGRQHYVTFDGHVVEFAGSCSYLLSYDFMDGNFTAIINYDNHYRGRPVKRSLTLWMDGKEIEVFLNFQVFVDGKKVELPYSYDETAIIRDGNQTIVKTGYGVTVTCRWTYDVCTFKVSGWYFGRLAGLLGIYNYEPVDDVITPNGKASLYQLGNWGNEWAVNQPYTCHSKENLAVEATRKDPTAELLCMDLFNNTFSLFKYCFEKVDPLPFLNMCLSDVHTLHTPEDICTSAEAYVQTCHAHDVLLRIPKACVKCHLPNGHILNEAGNITMNSSLKMSDVVIIIEAKKCNRGIVDIFRDLVYNIDSAMQTAAITERRYATVVFGGSGVYDAPHVLTSDSRIFTSHRTVSPLHNFKVGRGTHDFFDALRFASKLPFRPGASKNFVVLTCSIGESVTMRKDYPEVHRMLLEDGITVHLLLDREFEMTRSDILLYGIDGVNAYTTKDSRPHFRLGDPDLRRQVMPPKDICVPVVLESNGTVFSSLRLNDTKKMVKSFLDVYSRRIAQSAEMPVCQTCDCFPNDEGVGRIYCQPCIFPKPAHFYVDPSNFYEVEYSSIYHMSEDHEEDYNFDELEKQHWRTSNRPF